MTENILKPGQIWKVKKVIRTFDNRIYKKIKEELLVIIAYAWQRNISFSNCIRVWPVTYCADRDLVSPDDVRIQDFRAEAWNERPMLAINLNQSIGKISEKDFGKIINRRKKIIESQGNLQIIKSIWRSDEVKRFQVLSEPVLDLIWRDVE